MFVDDHQSYTITDNVPLCVGGSTGKAEIQMWCIPEGRDTNNLYPENDATLYIGTGNPLLILGLNLLIILSLHLNLVTL